MNKNLSRSTSISTVIAAGGLCSVPALAQNEAVGINGGIEEIIVTAQRREESLQKAGIAIDAISGDALTRGGILDSTDLGKSVPALSLANGGGSNTSIIIRGVGNIAPSSYLDSAVSPSYDGVVMGRGSGAFAAAFYDLARVEVLKGPQGILYGRNATGGAINIIPNPPELARSGGGFNLGYGNFDAIQADAYVNLTVGDNSALRVAGTVQRRDAYNRDGSDDLDRTGLRAQFLTEVNDRLTIRVGADYTWVRGVGPGTSYVGHFVQGNFVTAPTDEHEGMNTDAANAYRQTVIGAPGFGFLAPMNRQQELRYDYYGVNAEITLDTGIGKFTVIPAYRVSDGFSYFYGPAFNTGLFDEKDTQYSLEARLAGSTGMLDYVLGGFYFDEKVDFIGEFNQEFVLPMQKYESGTKSLAAFGQLTANLSDRFRLIGGLRYTKDNKFIDGNITNFIAFCQLPPAPRPACRADGVLPHFPNFTDPQLAFDWLIDNGFIAPTSVLNPSAAVQVFPNLKLPGGFIQKAVSAPADSGSFDKLNWKIGAEFDITSENLLYATAQTGYRAGGFQLASNNTTYNPENIVAFTVGSKNRFFGNKVQLNFEAFWWKYKDQQITYFTVDAATSTLVSSTQNVGKSEIKGFDIDAIVRPMRNTTLSAKVQYLDTAYKDLHLITAPPRDNYNCPVTNTGQTTNTGAPILDFDCSGKPLIYAPKWTINMGVEQRVPLGGIELILAADTSWRDKQFTQFNFLDFQQTRPHWLSNASLTVLLPDHDVGVSFYVNNIENDRQIGFGQASPIGFATTRFTAPRTYGMRLSATF